MGNRKAREFLSKQEVEDAWHRARTEPRMATDDIPTIRGIGIRRLQVTVCPPFDEGQSWEVRQRESKWFLYRQRVVVPWPSIQVVGYDPVPCPDKVLSGFFSRMTGLTLPLVPYLNGMSGFDGTTTQLAIYGDMWSEWRFQWWSESPPQWQPLVTLTEEMLASFTEVASKGVP